MSLTDRSPTLRDLEILNAGATLSISSGRGITIAPPALEIEGLTCNGSLLLNASGGTSNTFLSFNRALPGLLPFDGSGKVYLNANVGNLDTAHLTTVNNTVVGIGGNLTISGLGRFYGRYQLAGRILSNDPFGGAISIYGASITQHASGSGRIHVDTARVDFQENSTIIGIPIAATNGGRVRAFHDGGTTTLTNLALAAPLSIFRTGNGNRHTMHFNNVDYTGTLSLGNGCTLGVSDPDFNATADITVNTDAVNANALIHFNQTGSLSGDGTILLNANISNLDSAHLSTGNNVLTTIGPDWTISGLGRIFGRYVLAGTILSDDLFGGAISIYGASITQHASGSGRIHVDTARVDFQENSTIIGIPIAATNGGRVRAFHDGGTTTLTNLALAAPLSIFRTGNGNRHTMHFNNVDYTGTLSLGNGCTLGVSDPDFNASADITVNTDAVNANALIYFNQTGVLSGGGTILLNANVANLDSAYIDNPANITTTVRAGWTLSGLGRVRGRFVHEGLVAPSSPAAVSEVGQIDVVGSLALRASSAYEVHIAGVSSHDRLTGGTKSVAGTLRVRPLPSYAPASGDSFTIVSGGTVTGRFDTLDAPSLPGLTWTLEYPSNAVILKVGCYADCDPSTGTGTLDVFDFLCFQNRYAALDPYACDCDTSTGPAVCDVFDFLCFQNSFAAGCP